MTECNPLKQTSFSTCNNTIQKKASNTILYWTMVTNTYNTEKSLPNEHHHKDKKVHNFPLLKQNPENHKHQYTMKSIRQRNYQSPSSAPKRISKHKVCSEEGIAWTSCQEKAKHKRSNTNSRNKRKPDGSNLKLKLLWAKKAEELEEIMDGAWNAAIVGGSKHRRRKVPKEHAIMEQTIRWGLIVAVRFGSASKGYDRNFTFIYP